MAENKTKATTQSVAAFLNAVEHERRRNEAKTIKKMMDRATPWRAKMWGDSLIGYGTYHYKYDSGREGDFFVTGFSPRKAAMTVYIVNGFKPYGALLKKLGPHKHSSSCLYLSNLEKIDMGALEELVTRSVADMRKKYNLK